MSLSEDDDVLSCRLQRGFKTDSYIFAIQNNQIPITLDSAIDDFVIGKHLVIHNENTKFLNQPVNKFCKKKRLLNREDLELYRNDPFWKRLRWILFTLFCLIFIFVIFFILLSPRCVPIKKNKWWTTAVIYELWTFSFQDSNFDGFGDLLGLKSRLPDLYKIGANAIFPRQFIETDDTGLGVLNYDKLHKNIGTMDDAMKLIIAAHDLGIKVIIDFPLVVTSNAHNWFDRSADTVKSKDAIHSSFYYWKQNAQPSEFVSKYKNSSLYYFHVKNRPDLPILNWNSVLVSQAIKKALSFWIDKNIDGIHFSFVDYLHRSIDGVLPEWDMIVNFLHNISNYVQKYSQNSDMTDNKEIFVFASPHDLKEEDKRRLAIEGGLNGIMNTELSRIALKNSICYKNEETVAGCTSEILSDLLGFYSREKIWPVWSFGGSFTSRLASRIKNRKQAELLLMIEMCLPGTPIFYYGDELGLEDSYVEDEKKLYGGRSLMPWNEKIANALNSTENISFIQQYNNYKSQLWTFKRLARLRKRPVLIHGHTKIGAEVNNGFALCRYSVPNDTSSFLEVIFTAVNLGAWPVTLPLFDLLPFPTESRELSFKVLIINSANQRFYPYQRITIPYTGFRMEPNEGVVIMLN